MKSNFVYQRFNRPPLVGHFFLCDEKKREKWRNVGELSKEKEHEEHPPKTVQYSTVQYIIV